MNVLVFGATGKTGSLVVTRALAQGHNVSALVRHPAAHSLPAVNVLHGDATNAGDVARAMPGNDAVINTIGGTRPYLHQTFESDAIHNIIASMKAASVPRLIVVTLLGLGDSRAQAPFWYKHLLMPTFLRGEIPDKTAVELAVFSSGLQFVIARPPILTQTPAVGARILTRSQIAHRVSRADLANFLVDQLTTDVNLGQAVTIANS